MGPKKSWAQGLGLVGLETGPALDMVGLVAYAAMLDTGNFVLAANTSAVLWQSFDFPTDTLLPSQVLSRGDVLVSTFSELNHSRGKFKMTLQPDGNLMLDTRSFPLDDKVDATGRRELMESDSG